MLNTSRVMTSCAFRQLKLLFPLGVKNVSFYLRVLRSLGAFELVGSRCMR